MIHPDSRLSQMTIINNNTLPETNISHPTRNPSKKKLSYNFGIISFHVLAASFMEKLL